MTEKIETCECDYAAYDGEGFTCEPCRAKEEMEQMAETTSAEVKEYWESRSFQPYGAQPSEKSWSISCDTEEVITLYGALRTYLKVLTQQPDEDLETIARVTRLMIAIKPQAVEASQEIAGREK
jgi:hypothetical protein